MTFKSLEALVDSGYAKARDSLIEARRSEVQSQVSSKPGPIPDLAAALRIRVEEPVKSEQYSGALALEYTGYLNPRQHVHTPTSDQLKTFLQGYGTEYLPLLEEYFFHFPSKLSNTGTRAAAMLLMESDANRCKQIAALSYAKFPTNPQAQHAILTAIEYCKAESATKDLWNTLSSATDSLLRLNVQYVLAGFGDRKMKAVIESSLSRYDLDYVARSSAISAYLQYFTGTRDEKLVQAFRKFRNPLTQLEITRNLMVTEREIADVLAGLKREAADEKVKAALQEQITRFESMDRER